MESTAKIIDPQYPTKLLIHHKAYLERPEVSNSLLQRVGQSPAHAIEWLKNPLEPTSAQILGTRTHEGILLPDLFKENYCIEPKFDKRTKIGKEASEKWILDNPNKVPIGEDQFNQILGMIESVYNHNVASQWLSGGQSEVSFFFKDPDTDIACKIRPDHINKDCIIDIKTTEDASMTSFARSIFNYKYHHQGAFYLDGAEVATGQRFNKFVIIAVEKKPPYAVAVYSIDENSLGKGRYLYRRNLNVWSECLRTDKFPAYPEEMRAISIPHWGFDE